MSFFLSKKLNWIILFLVFVFLIVGIFLVFVPEVRNLVLKEIIVKETVPEGVLDHSQFGQVKSNDLEIIFKQNTTRAQRIETLEKFNATSSEYGVKIWGANGVYKLMNEPTQDEYDTVLKTLEDVPYVRFVVPLQIMD